MDEALASDLLVSIEADRLSILCGAGLSMAAPSLVPGAAQLAHDCAEIYRSITGYELSREISTDIESIAEYFYKRQTFVNYFIRKLIPWHCFRDRPNQGHFAIADFLACQVFDFAVTTNIDTLIEDAAKSLGEKDFYPAIDGQEANAVRQHRTLLKIHGCCYRDRDNTVWCRRQLQDELLSSRIEYSKRWLEGHLLSRDLIILGFWTDWSYLNSVLEDCVSNVEPNLIVLVDSQTTDNLEAKAPSLWSWAHSGRVNFVHVRESGDTFLNDLRKRFSQRFLIRLLQDAIPTYQTLTQERLETLTDIYCDLSSDELYALRRDCCGETALGIVRVKRPTDMNRLGAIILTLISHGATIEGATYVLENQRIRVVNSSGKLISEVRGLFSTEPPLPIPNNITICVGALDDGEVPTDVVRGEGVDNIIRPSVSGRWISDEQALAEFGVLR